MEIATLPVNNRESRAAEVDALLAEHGTSKSERKPRVPPLTREDLMSEKGIGYVKTNGPNLQFKGKGFEAEDLSKLCVFYKDWAHQLAPKLTFQAFTAKVDKMCRQRTLKRYWNSACGRENEAVANANLVQDEYDMNNDDVQEMSDAEETAKPIRRLVTTNASFGFEDAEQSENEETNQDNDIITAAIEDDDEDDEELELSIFQN